MDWRIVAMTIEYSTYRLSLEPRGSARAAEAPSGPETKRAKPLQAATLRHDKHTIQLGCAYYPPPSSCSALDWPGRSVLQNAPHPPHSLGAAMVSTMKQRMKMTVTTPTRLSPPHTTR